MNMFDVKKVPICMLQQLRKPRCILKIFFLTDWKDAEFFAQTLVSFLRNYLTLSISESILIL